MSQKRVKRELKAAGTRNRYPWPRAPKHGKHTELQGFPNTRGLSSASAPKSKKVALPTHS